MIPKNQDSIGAILAVGLLCITAGCVVAIFTVPIPSDNQTLVGQAVGTLLGLLGMVVSYFYGASVGQLKTQETLQTVADTAKIAQTTLSGTGAITPGEVTLQAGDKVEVKAEP